VSCGDLWEVVCLCVGEVKCLSLPPCATRARVFFLSPPPVVTKGVLVCLPHGVGVSLYCATHVHRWVWCEVWSTRW